MQSFLYFFVLVKGYEIVLKISEIRENRLRWYLNLVYAVFQHMEANESVSRYLNIPMLSIHLLFFFEYFDIYFHQFNTAKFIFFIFETFA